MPNEPTENDLPTVAQIVEDLTRLKALLKVYSGVHSPLGAAERRNLSLHVSILDSDIQSLTELEWVQTRLI